MSTRSALAYIPQKDEVKSGEWKIDSKAEWTGIYCHSDGYPTARGKEIWDILHKDFFGNEGGIGIQNDKNPRNAIRAFIDIYVKGHRSGWSSFPDSCYCHDPAFVLRDGIRDSVIDSTSPDPLSIEYVYILDQKTLTMTILSSKVESKDLPVGDLKKLKNGHWDYGHCEAWHTKLAEIDLLGKEPDWQKLEALE